jgi:hypothetical protein
MTFITDFISQYGMVIIYAVLTAIAGFLGSRFKKIYEKHNEDDTKRRVAETCVKAVEQLYKGLKGSEKLEKAKENIVAMLAIKGIDIADIELDMLIESCVAEFNINFKKENSNGIS